MELFTEDDFKTQTAWATHSKSLAAIANKKLKELIEASTVVFCDQDELHFSGNEEVGYTHKGYLIGVEEIKEPKLCNHEPILGTFNFSYWQKGVCRHCGIELQATWSEKK